ncbi:hypothetical protein BSL78_11173 [Apostichopus japonicus]|uniref:NACHT domain-containing protein n=1 Tax=Stichopus japonicus TaxID=307972 RepID=A0A2G8KVH4_STIJA|nr:hypothetical protein BSL78_11173 [Apostichopus japonicus]
MGNVKAKESTAASIEHRSNDGDKEDIETTIAIDTTSQLHPTRSGTSTGTQSLRQTNPERGSRVQSAEVKDVAAQVQSINIKKSSAVSQAQNAADLERSAVALDTTEESVSSPYDKTPAPTTLLDEKKNVIVNGLKKHYREQYENVRPIPYFQDRNYSVVDIFVESGMQILVNQPGLAGSSMWNRLSSYKNIFDDPRMRSTRRILEGEPGYGKSTLTLKLAYDWCNDVRDSPLFGIEILIILRMRQLNNVSSIYRAIKLYLLRNEERVKQSDIRKVLESCKAVAILLDGYDEYPVGDNDGESDVRRIIMSKMLQECDVTLTTRYLPDEYDKEITRLLKLTGFDETARDQYIRLAITGDEKAIEKIKIGLRDNPILDALCQVPLFFVMFAHMTHERDDFQKFKCVTEFFKYVVICFHKHARNKTTDYNAERYNPYYEADHGKLNKLAFEGLCTKKQHIAWSKEYLCQVLGNEFYDHYIFVGILVGEEVLDIDGEDTIAEEDTKVRIEVRFYHKLVCEWYASFRVTEIAVTQSETELKTILDKLDPFDLQYLFRFACGLNQLAGSKIIKYLMNRKDGEKFAILCILEQKGTVESIEDTVSALCSKRMQIHENESKLLQRSTIQLLEIASSHGIRISNLYLNWSLREVVRGVVNLTSGLCIQALTTLEKISISAKELSENDVAELLRYGQQAESFKELWFLNCQLPESFSPENIPNDSKERNIKVVWPSFGRHLNLQSGKWQKADDKETVAEMCADVVVISNNNDKLLQESAIELLEKASSRDIRISRVYLHESFSSLTENIMHLRSGLSLPILKSLETIGIETEKGREIDHFEMVGILNYGLQSQRFKKLRFFFCVLPFAVLDDTALTSVKRKNVTGTREIIK